MPRHARLVVPDVPVHLIQRGHNRNACFFCDDDFQYYLRWMMRFAKESACDIHSYVLMTNHVHLALTPHDIGSLALLMKTLNQRYVAHINRKRNWTGTLWEGRFKSCLIFDQSYFLTCMRYIELNPVRAGMVGHPRDYPWSSYSANAEGIFNPCITPHEIYQSLGSTEADQRSAYRNFLASKDDQITTDNIRRATNGNYALGETISTEELASTLGRRVTPGKRGRPHK
ncbi:transposase [Duganella sp. Root1480D1]|uniref:transposase n=1 Tax=Duganella sp. Root1480D1 TaxID=1736471 RepID=UPI000710E1C8|nr:transposase [Duganella sp. Root1480D1]KQZ45046.1 transposase [Duganella sp. Root1480D1]